MARKGQDSSKFKGDKQPLKADMEGEYYAPADYTSNPQEYGGECEPAPRTAPYEEVCALEADDTVCGGSLRVTAYVDCDEEANDDSHTDYEGEEDSEAHYLEGVEISIQGLGIIDTELTNADGFVTWSVLPPGQYQVTAFIPPGYDSSPSSENTESTNSDSSAMTIGSAGGTGAAPAKDYGSQTDARPSIVLPNVVVEEGLEATADFHFSPKPALLRVSAFYDAERSDNPYGQHSINNVPVDVYRGSTRIGCFRTGGELETGIQLRPCGTYTVRGRSPIKIMGRTYRLAHNRSIAVNAVPEGDTSIALGYVTESGAVQVSACVEWEQHGKTHKSFLKDVTFKLFDGMGTSGEPLQVGTTSGPLPITFYDLPTGLTYTLVVDGPRNRFFKGQTIELHDPPDGIQTFVLNGSESEPDSFEFCFKPCESSISGRVTYEQSCEPAPGVPVTIFRVDGAGKPITVYSDDKGRWDALNLKPGDYIVAAQPFTRDGKKFVPAQGAKKEQRIKVISSGMTEAEDIQVAEDIHRIFGYVRDADGNPIIAATVEIRDSRDQLIATPITRKDPPGFYEYIVDVAGEYFVTLRENANGAPIQRFPVRVNSDAQQDLTSGALVPPTGDGGRFGGPGNFRDAVQTAFEPISDLASFPVLTEEVNFPASPRPAWPGGSGSAPIGVMIEGAIREVLGWKPRNDDPKGFIGALTQSFTCTEVEGHTECKWVPRTYAVQTDLSGGITGAQASVYKRAQDAVDQSMPILDGLYPLRSDADEQDIEALRAVVKNQMTEIVRELGIPGGPRVTRVDQLFSLLLGTAITPDPDDVAGQLGILRREFGLRSRPSATEQGNLINTVEEEQNLTNFRILSDYMTSLRQSWINNRDFFVRPAQNPFYGTQLVLLSRGLNVVAESVEEVRFTMDSVMIGPAERQTLEIRFPLTVLLPPHQPTPPVFNSQGVLVQQPDPINDGAVNGQPMFVEELLTWVSSFSTEEGPRLIQDGGKFAVNNTFLPVVCQLRNLVLGAIAPLNLQSLPRGYRTPRVQRALQELALQLDELAVLANPIQHQIPSQT